MSEQTPPTGRARQRSRGFGRDMVLSLGLVAVVLAGWLLFSHPATPERGEVQWWPVALTASETAGFEVLAPPQATTWPATAAWMDPLEDGTLEWRVGFQTPSGEFVSVVQRGVLPDQATGTKRDWVRETTRNGETQEDNGDQGQTVMLGSRDWLRMVGDPEPDRRLSLVLYDGGTITVVTGSADWPTLDAVAAGLRPVLARDA